MSAVNVFAPMFARTPPPAAPGQSWRLYALRYPAPEAASDAVDAALVERPRVATVSWLGTILRARWQPPAATTWIGLRSSELGPEVLFGAWHSDDRLIQVAARKGDLHLRTALGPLRDPRDDHEVLSNVILLCDALTNANPERDLRSYRLERLGDFLVGDTLREPRWGWRAFSFATDRVGVKLSFPLATDRRRIKGVAPPSLDERPWFEPEPAPATR
jgi:hypothetical protein